MSAAQRRKQRRLRSWWRHEQQSIAAALATTLHHTSRGQRKARAGEEESETKYTAKFRTTPPPQPVLFSLYDEEPGGRRPASLAEPPRPQERVPRHTMEHITDLVRVAPRVQILDAPVPQTVDKLHDVLQFFDRLSTVPEPVIEVPKIITEDVPMRAVLRATQLAEQLVDVPTNPGYALAVVAIQTLGWRTAAALIEQFDTPARGVVVVAVGRFSCSSPGEGTPPGQGVIQILAIVVAPLGDVPVTMQRQFQQFVVFFVPQVQFLDRMVDIPVFLRLQWQKTVEFPQLPFLGCVCSVRQWIQILRQRGRLLE